MPRRLPYMKWYWGEFLRAAHGLTAQEGGALTFLMGYAWENQGAVPDDDRRLARIARVDSRQWPKVKPLVMRVFEPGAPGLLVHFEIQKQLRETHETLGKRKLAAFLRHHGDTEGLQASPELAALVKRQN